MRAAADQGCDLSELGVETLRTFSALVGDDVLQVLTLEGSVSARRHRGGTAPEAVRQAITRARARLSAA